MAGDIDLQTIIDGFRASRVADVNCLTWNSANTLLAANALHTGITRDGGATDGGISSFSYFNSFFYSAQAGTASIEGSWDGITWLQVDTASLIANTPLVRRQTVLFRYYRNKLLNGATAQTVLQMSSSYTVAQVLIVETGLGIAGAESYVSVADADTYFANRNNTVWAALDVAHKESALRLATDFMVDTFRQYWKGYRNVPSQALDWPRYGVVIEDNINIIYYNTRYLQTQYVLNNIVPNEVKQSTCEFALVASTGQLNPNMSRGKKHVKIGTLEVEYDGNANIQVKLNVAVARLSVYLQGNGITSGNMARLARV